MACPTTDSTGGWKVLIAHGCRMTAPVIFRPRNRGFRFSASISRKGSSGTRSLQRRHVLSLPYQPPHDRLKSSRRKRWRPSWEAEGAPYEQGEQEPEVD